MPKRITEQEYREYERLLKKYQKMRRNIIKAHQKIYESSGYSSRLVQMVAPERERKVKLGQFRLSGRRIFALKMKQLKKFVSGGYQEFYSDYKKQYLILYQVLLDESPEYNPFHRGRGFLYSEEQMKLASDYEKQVMENYNNLVRMNSMVFAYMIKTGRIPEFKKIYNEMHGTAKTQEHWIDVMTKSISMARRFSVRDAERFLSGYDIPEATTMKYKKEQYAKK